MKSLLVNKIKPERRDKTREFIKNDMKYKVTAKLKCFLLIKKSFQFESSTATEM